jgi:hypothetical protein
LPSSSTSDGITASKKMILHRSVLGPQLRDLLHFIVQRFGNVDIFVRGGKNGPSRKNIDVG